MKQESTNWL